MPLGKSAQEWELEFRSPELIKKLDKLVAIRSPNTQETEMEISRASWLTRTCKLHIQPETLPQ